MVVATFGNIMALKDKRKAANDALYDATKTIVAVRGTSLIDASKKRIFKIVVDSPEDKND